MMGPFHRRARRGFSLLECLVAMAILVASLGILIETQAGAAVITMEAERVLLATDLANAKMNEALRYLEEEGFQNSEVHESGDFDDWGDEASNLEFKDTLEDYNWDFWISEIDLALAGDIAGMASELQGSGVMGGGGGDAGPDLGSVGAGGANPLAGIGMSSEMITEMLTPYIREVRVRVWWGKDSEEAEEKGNQVVIVTHNVNPSGIISMGQEGTQ